MKWTLTRWDFKDMFQVGLNEAIRSGLPGGKIPFPLAEYIDYALLLCGSSFTVGVMEAEHDTSSKPAHVMPAKLRSAHVMPAKATACSHHVCYAKAC